MSSKLFAIIFLTLIIPSTAAAEVFSDDFETGDFGKWTQTIQEPGNTIEAITQAVIRIKAPKKIRLVVFGK